MKQQTFSRSGENRDHTSQQPPRVQHSEHKKYVPKQEEQGERRRENFIPEAHKREVMKLHREITQMGMEFSLFDCLTCLTENNYNYDVSMDAIIDGRYKPWKVDNKKVGGDHAVQQRKHENLHKNKPFRSVALKFFEEPVANVIEEIKIEVPEDALNEVPVPKQKKQPKAKEAVKPIEVVVVEEKPAEVKQDKKKAKEPKAEPKVEKKEEPIEEINIEVVEAPQKEKKQKTEQIERKQAQIEKLKNKAHQAANVPAKAPVEEIVKVEVPMTQEAAPQAQPQQPNPFAQYPFAGFQFPGYPYPMPFGMIPPGQMPPGLNPQAMPPMSGIPYGMPYPPYGFPPYGLMPMQPPAQPQAQPQQK